MRPFVFAILLLTSTILFCQTRFEIGSDLAYENAKKGVVFAFRNIPPKKRKYEEEIIFEDKLIAKVKISKESEGIRVESIGFSGSNEVSIKLYRSFDFLKKEGYLIE